MRIRRPIRVLLLAASVTLFGACDDITGNGRDASIIVENSASVSVFEIFIADCDDDTWGGDELGPNETIRPGEDRVFGVDEGCYDLRARFADNTFAEDFGIDLRDGDEFTWELVD